MSYLPTFNYKTVYFFIMSLFGIVLVLTLIDLVKVQYPMAIAFTSLVNVFLGIIAWICDTNYEQSFERNRIINGRTEELCKSFHDKKSRNLVRVTACTFISSTIGLIIQSF